MILALSKAAGDFVGVVSGVGVASPAVLLGVQHRHHIDHRLRITFRVALVAVAADYGGEIYGAARLRRVSHGCSFRVLRGR